MSNENGPFFAVHIFSSNNNEYIKDRETLISDRISLFLNILVLSAQTKFSENKLINTND